MSAFAENVVFENELMPNGAPNPRFIDHNTRLPNSLPDGYNYIAWAFISPDEIMKQQHMFFFERFVEEWPYLKVMESQLDFLHFIGKKYNLSLTSLQADFQELVDVKNEELLQFGAEHEFQLFVKGHKERLTKEYKEKFPNTPITERGLYSFGAFQSDSLDPEDPNADFAHFYQKNKEQLQNFRIFLGPTGYLLNARPDISSIKNQRDANDKLNNLLHQKKENEKLAAKHFEERRQKKKIEHFENNVKLAEETGAKMTQLMDENGNLVSVQERILQEIEERDLAELPPPKV